MTDARPRLVAAALPPLTLSRQGPLRARHTEPLSRLARLALVLAALALPVLGIAVADTVHRVGEPKATQAAAPVLPPKGAAAPHRTVTAASVTKLAALDDRAGTARP